jgi:Ser/Thr protein kinase RdoA (MazF antagonist)
MSLAAQVLAYYPAPVRGTVTALGNHGGFSGARLFRVEAPAGAFCLRAWPPDISSPRLHTIHSLIRRATDAGVDFVPRVVPTAAGQPFVAAADRLWELTDWMPGAATFHRDPTPERLRTACTALARLHRAWSEPNPRRAVCPAVERRLAAARDWLALTSAGWRPAPDPSDPVAPCVGHTWDLLRRRIPEVPALLDPWLRRPVALQPCLCDVWHDHVLFTGDRVSGLVDFGSVKVDHVAVDLSRLLGSLVGGDTARWCAGLQHYEEQRPLTAEERELARDLDRTGTVVAAANWLRWLYHERRAYDRPAVGRRLAGLVERMEGSN